ncbi:MAG: sn-glycerol-3-phosphate ABC transporter ATP-binding protein UgpC [Undibacterium sp.]|nr:sn-glycerol-3-phosphate ABC transporter ATP-binding protein UgpC [Undibacterium sp.]
MAAVTLKHISKFYDPEVPIIRSVDLQIKDGEFIVFVGPSGCGKSTLLRLIAGLEEISDGEMWIDGVLANEVHAAKRGVAMVFQSYALYPHMTVEKNMGFALKMAGVPKKEVASRVRAVAEILQMEDLLERKPKELSGGQRQRVAIGRAIIREPKVFLFDEPLSNLDASLRQNMRIELAKLHKKLGTTMIYVTHDQVEAMTLADRIVLFNQGEIQQIGTPLELYDQPANLFVAGFLGAPKMNFIEGSLGSMTNHSATLSLGNKISVKAYIDASDTRDLTTDTVLTLGIRPEHVTLGQADAANAIAAQVSLIEHLGDQLLIYFTLAGSTQNHCLKCVDRSIQVTLGQVIYVQFPPQHCLIFDRDGKAFQRLENIL